MSILMKAGDRVRLKLNGKVGTVVSLGCGDDDCDIVECRRFIKVRVDGETGAHYEEANQVFFIREPGFINRKGINV